MTHPPAQPGYPPAQPGYPPAQPGYPPEPQGYVQQQQQQQGWPAAGYPQQAPQYQGYPPQGPPAPVLPKTGLADFMDQPAMSGGALSFPAPGTRHDIMVARDLTDADFPVQTDPQGQAKRFRDGRPMVVMVVPCLIRPDAEHPDGHASWWVKGQAAEALKQAMSLASAGDRNGIPEKGALIGVLHTMVKPSKRGGQNPTKIYEVTYQRPAGAGNGQQAEQPAPAPQQPAPQSWENPQFPAQSQYVPPVQGAAQPLANYQPPGFPQGPQPVLAQPAPQYQPPAAPPVPAYGPVPPGQPVSQPPPSVVGAQVAAATQAGLNAAAAAAPPPPQITPENAALVASLTGGQPPQAPPQQ